MNSFFPLLCDKVWVFLLVFCGMATSSQAQNGWTNGNISGNFQVQSQYYVNDSAINATTFEEVGNPALNAAFQLLYETKRLKLGVRYEAYLPPLLGFDENYRGHGIANRFATYSHKGLEVTAGHFYEQFGSGIVLRSYFEPQLGVDNAIDGLRFTYNHKNRWNITGLVGKHRLFFELGEGIIKAVNAEVNVLETIQPSEEGKARKWQLYKGNSFVDKFEPYTGTRDFVPVNVWAISDRWRLTNEHFSFSLENVWKSSDPTVLNSNIIKKGHAISFASSYSKKGLGIQINLQRLDNMNFRSERNDQSLTNLFMNFLPALSKQHTYRLLTLYPQTVQPQGEVSTQVEIYHKIKKRTALGGKYGVNLNLNFTRVHGLKTTETGTQEGYNSEFFAIGEELYYQDIHLEIQKKWSKRLKTNLLYVHLNYNKTVMEGVPTSSLIKSHVGVLEMSYKLPKRQALRIETQHLYTKQDFGSWAMLLTEYSKFPNLSFFLSDEYNYTNNIHYYSGGMSYVKGAHRFSLSYGRQRAGLLCVGGICRLVPAATGLLCTASGSF